MPTYRYRCRTCGDELEVWQSFTEDPVRRHDGTCGGELVKVLSPAGIVLKGSGFYRNDSRPSNGKRSKRTDDKDSSSTDSTKSTTSDTASSSTSSSGAGAGSSGAGSSKGSDSSKESSSSKGSDSSS